MKLYKQIAATLAAAVLAGSCITPAAASAADSQQKLTVTRYGDATMDGSVDVADAVLTARYVASDTSAKITDNGRLNADVTLDGNVDTDDITQILEYIAKKRNYLGKEESSAQGYKAHSLTESLTANQIADKAVDDAFVKSQYDLTAKLMKEVSFSDEENDNILLSPLSIASALAMTANGANGETRAEMEQLLGGSISMEALNEYYHNYLANLPSSDKAKLHLANSLWNSEELQIRDDYLQTVKDYYPNMDVFKAPFKDSTLNEINSWISDNTDEMIQNMLDYMDPNAVTYLINALAFDAEWETAWKNTVQSTFSDYNGTKQDVPMMCGSESYYISDKYAEGFVKEYAGGTYSFVGILPRESMSVTLSDYLGMMSGTSIQELLGSREKTEVDVMLPKFSFSYDTLLNDALKNLGVKKAFDDGQSDFSKLYEKDWGGVYIGRVLHNTFIDVNEQGTQAAAATVVEMTRKGGVTRELNFSRPFIFMILDERTKLPVFIGSVRNPQADDAPQAPVQQELQKDEIRFTVMDADTGKLIPLDDEHRVSISTYIAYHTEHGDVMTGPVYSISQNPYIVKDNLAKHFNADSFSMTVSPYGLPDGYTLPEENISWKKNENGSADITVRLKAKPALKEGEVRFTVVDRTTGEQIKLDKDHSLLIYTDYIEQPDNPVIGLPVLTLDQNPITVENYANCCDPANNLHPVVHISSLSGRYELKKNHMQMTKYSNGSYDIRILLDEIIYVPNS